MAEPLSQTAPAPAHTRALARAGSVIAALVVAFFLVRMLGAPWPHFPPTYPDSFSYLKVATHGPFRPHFYFDERPIGYPLLLWAVGRSSTMVVVTQTLVYVAAFWLLCRVVGLVVRSRAVLVGAVVFIAAIAIEPRNSLWNTLMLSESLSSSMSVVSIAAWLLAAARPSKRTVTWAWIATGAWILVRDSNVLPTLAVIVPAALIVAFVSPQVDREMRRRLVSGAVVIVVVCAYVYVAQAQSLRNQYPVNNNVGMRILPNPTFTKYFVDGGMPLDDALRARINHNSWDDGEAFLRAPELARYRTWARGPGSRRLFLSMVVLAPEWWKSFHKELPNILRDVNQGYDSYGVFGRFPHHFPPPLGEPRTNAGLWAALALAAAALGIAAADRRRRLLVYVVAVGLISAIVEIWFSYGGDAMEVDRHLVGPLVRLNVLAIVAIALGADALVAWSGGDEEPDEPEAEAPNTPATDDAPPEPVAAIQGAGADD